jgi:hypothetical protein
MPSSVVLVIFLQIYIVLWSRLQADEVRQNKLCGIYLTSDVMTVSYISIAKLQLYSSTNVDSGTSIIPRLTERWRLEESRTILKSVQ